MVKLLLSFILIGSFANAGEPTFNDVRSLVLKSKAATVADALAQLKTAYPAFFEGYTLAYDSRSLQGGSFDNPRAIVFGQSANLVLTFNGRAPQRGSSTIEAVSFDPVKGYEFREIRFLKEPQSSSLVEPEELEEITKNVAVSKANPHVCLLCHSQTAPHPIWQNYPTWPGIYGSNDDETYRQTYSHIYAEHTAHQKYDGMKQLFSLRGMNPEREHYRRFMVRKNRPGSRYRFLSDRPLAPETPLNPLSGEALEGSSSRLNFALSQLFSSQMAKLLMRDVYVGPHRKTRLVFIANALCREPSQMDAFALPYFNNQKLTDEVTSKFEREKKENEADVVTRMVENFGGHMYSPATGRKDVASLIKEDQDYFGSGVDSYGVRLAIALKALGRELPDYALNQSRYDDFSVDPAGELNYYFMRKAVVNELSLAPETRNLSSAFAECSNPYFE